MCNPAFLILAASAVSAYSQYKSGEANSDLARADAAQARINARDASQRAGVAEQNYLDKTAKEQGEARARIGASGFDVSGTSGDILAENEKIRAQQARTIRVNGIREALGFQSQAASLTYQGRLDRRQGYLQAGGTLLGGSADAYASYKRIGKQ